MVMNAAETPLAAPLKYAEAAERVRPPEKPQPLGIDYARGLNEHAVTLELTARAREQMTVKTDNSVRREKDLPNASKERARENPAASSRQSEDEPLQNRTDDGLNGPEPESSPVKTTGAESPHQPEKDAVMRHRLEPPPPILPSGATSEYAYRAYTAVDTLAETA